MKFRKLAKALAVVLTTTPLTLAVAHAYELVIPGLMYRTGPYAPNGIPFANGFADYLNLLNERDGGIEGLKIKYTECILIVGIINDNDSTKYKRKPMY